MNVHDELSDNEVLRAAADSLSAMPLAQAPDARAVMARGRARRHRRQAGIGLAGTAAAAAAAIGLAGVLAGGPAPALATGTIRDAAFTLVKNDNGSVALTLSQHQVFNPNTLQQALEQDGIPALVKTGEFCSSQPAVEGGGGVVSLQLPDGTPVPKSTPGNSSPVPPDAVTVITPAAIPTGAELFFGYFNGDQILTFNLINADSYTCSSSPPQGH
jgi:hypothetical protein